MSHYTPTISAITQASYRIKKVVPKSTPFSESINLSQRYGASIFFKREDLQRVRSYKIRGSYNCIACLSEEELQRGIVCASAGNHAQGVAYACQMLGIQGDIVMPSTTPKQKVRQVQMFGKDNIRTHLVGDTFDDAFSEATRLGETNGLTFIHPFDDEKIIEGQGTVGLEIISQASTDIDYLFVPVGGGGLSAGVGSVFKELSPNTKIIGIEPEGAPALKQSLEKDEVITLDSIDKFVDGAAVKRVGSLNFPICKDVLHYVAVVPEGKVCSTILKLYNEEAIVVEPAGALSIAALDQYKEEIKGKNVVCIISGSNNDITRMEEIKERSLLFEGLKHYLIVNFPQRAGALKEFVNDMMGDTDDIVFFEYTKKINRESGPALVGVEVQSPSDFDTLVKRMADNHFEFEVLNKNETLFRVLI